MDMSLPRNSSLLEKWLEDMPNSNNQINVKKERKDFRDIFASNTITNNTTTNTSLPVSQSSNSSHSSAISSQTPQTGYKNNTNSTISSSKVSFISLTYNLIFN